MERGLPQQPQIQIDWYLQKQVQWIDQKFVVVCGQAHGEYQYLIGEERRDYDQYEDREGVSRGDQAGESRILPLYFSIIVQIHNLTSSIKQNTSKQLTL